MNNHPSIDELLEQIRAIFPPAAPVYLVGGCVRDLLLHQIPHDLDFVVVGEAVPYAQQVANRLDGAFFRLDDEHGGGRVLLPPIIEPGEDQWVIDFTPLTGSSLEEDLSSRDFTINAMAMHLHDKGTLIDPLGGAGDLHQKRLRACSSTSLINDPIRVLRAIRMVTSLHLQIESETLKWIRAAVPALTTTSQERQRDEFFRILSGPAPVIAIRLMDQLGIIPVLLPDLANMRGMEQPAPHIFDVWEHTLQTIARLEMLLSFLAEPGYDPERATNFAAGLAVLRLGRYREKFVAHFAQQYVQNRSARALLILAALYHDAGKPDTRSVDETGRSRFFGHEDLSADLCAVRMTTFRISNQEIRRVKTIIRHHMRLHQLAHSGEAPSRRAIFRYFQDTQEMGVDLCLLNLADLMATYGPTLPHETLQRYLDLHRILLEAYWEKPEEAVAPPKLVTGQDLLQSFNLEPGVIIGELLKQIQEAQAAGEVNTKEEALELARRSLSSYSP